MIPATGNVLSSTMIFGQIPKPWPLLIMEKQPQSLLISVIRLRKAPKLRAGSSPFEFPRCDHSPLANS